MVDGMRGQLVFLNRKSPRIYLKSTEIKEAWLKKNKKNPQTLTRQVSFLFKEAV